MMKSYKTFMEGTWALPGNDKKQKELIALFKKQQIKKSMTS